MTARTVYVHNGATWDQIGVAITPPGAALPPGGTTGQVLAKASASDGDVTWADQTDDAALDPFLLMGA